MVHRSGHKGHMDQGRRSKVKIITLKTYFQGIGMVYLTCDKGPKSKVPIVKVKGHMGQVKRYVGQIRIPRKGGWVHNNDTLLHSRLV